MKIIAKANEATYLCEITENEMAIISGYPGRHSDGWSRHTSYASVNRGFVGYEIKPAVLSSFHQTVEANEKKATDCAAMLHALAEMITHSLPTVVITPKAEVAPPVAAESAAAANA